MESTQAKRRLAAVLSADAVGYSGRMARDEVTTVQTVQSHLETIGGQVKDHRGRVVDAVGDNLLAEFPSAVDALACAMAAQRILQELNQVLPEECRLPFRMGLHLGELLVENGRPFGDAINIAARLEGLAEPGGVCASGALVEQVRGKIEAHFVDLGEQALKNIPVAVHVWRVREAQASAVQRSFAVPGFSGRPAIAIMPFEHVAADDDQAYLADGIAEDLISLLASYQNFPVIARSASFSYRGKDVDARRVGQELGARYVVEGSLRRSGRRIRVAVQLIDASIGHQIHSERYDRELEDVFALQDEIVQALVHAIEPALISVERRRASRKAPTSLDSWEALQRGNALFYAPACRDDWREAKNWYFRAIELDSGNARAYAMAAMWYWQEHYQSDVNEAQLLLAKGAELARASIRLAPEDALSHSVLGFCLTVSDPEGARRSCERAVEINPSDPHAMGSLGFALSSERPDEGLALIKKAVRLTPVGSYTGLFCHAVSVCAFLAERDDEAIDWIRTAHEHSYRVAASYRILAAALGFLGRADEAATAFARARSKDPACSEKALRVRNSDRLVRRMIEGWERAGLRLSEGD